MRRTHINHVSFCFSSGCRESTDRTPALSKTQLPFYKETPTRRFNHTHTPSPAQTGWAWWGRRRERARFGEKQGESRSCGSPSRAPPAAGSFRGALPRMRREPHGSLCGKSAEATTERITETRDQEQQAPSLPSVFLRPPPHCSPSPGRSLGPGPPASMAGSGIRESGTKAGTGAGGEGRRAAGKRGAEQTPSLHLARLRWRRGSSSEQPQLVPPATGRGDGGGGGGRKEGWRWHTMAVCVCGEETAHDSSPGGGSGLLRDPHSSSQIQGGEGVQGSHWGSGDSRVCLCVCVCVPFLFRGKGKNGQRYGGAGGEEAVERPPSCGKGRR